MPSRDIFTVHLTEHQDKQTAKRPTATDAEAAERFVCPVTHLHTTRYPFVAISSCGHVFSDRAIKQVTLQTTSLWLIPVTSVMMPG